MPSSPDHPDRYTMSFGDHLEELRRRLLLSLVVPLPLSVVTFLMSDTLIRWLLLPLYRVLARNGLDPEVQALSPPEVLVTKIKLSIILALVVSTPWVLWQIWRFVAPGLYRQERRFVHLLIPGSAVLTVAGIALLYFVMLPLMLQVLVMIGTRLDVGLEDGIVREQVIGVLEQAPTVELVTTAPAEPAPGACWLLLPQQKLYVATDDGDGGVDVHFVPRSFGGGVDQVYRVSYIINFVLLLMLGIALAFQMPLVIVLLGWVGLASAPWLRQRRRYALVVCGVVAAIITPADVISMLAMLVPLYGLYELGIVLLVVAPASAVAEGRLRFGRRADKGAADKPASAPAQTDEATQTAGTIARSRGPAQVEEPPADGREDDA
ncbi:MAG: twin-arginine translocase subunit TatC [Planctomycetota bacterium]|jgi:sec-independent protein translocase protein TatC